jgi:hypothetical protein
MTGKGRGFAPPPPHWPGRGPATPAGAAPARAGGQAVQAFRTFGALRAEKAERTRPGNELLPAHDGQFHMRTADRGLRVKPNGTYNFVRVHGETRNQAHTFVSSEASHARLAEGRGVLYAGTIRFDNGSIDWWSNYSGTYQPIAAFRQQAQLPDDRFVPWQRLQMGGNAMQRNTFSDRRSATAPPLAETGRTKADERQARAVPAAEPPKGAAAAPAARSTPSSAAPAAGTAARAPASATPTSATAPAATKPAKES